MTDKAIRAAKLTAAGLLDKARARTAVTRAGGQIAPSKYLPNVPRQVHADGGRVQARDAFLAGNHPAVPDVVYHGTSSAIQSFDRAKVGEGQLGFHFGSRQQAENFAENDNGNILPVHISMKNPIRLRDWGGWKPEKLVHQLADVGKISRIDAENLSNMYKKMPDEEDENNHFINLLRSMGHDGVVYLNRGEGLSSEDINRMHGENLHSAAIKMSDDDFRKNFPSSSDSFIAFDPRQVKSAIGNQGTFDPANSDMTKATGGRIGHADGGKAAFLAGNHPLVPDVLYHGTARDVHSFDPNAKRSYDVDPSNPEETDTGWFGKGHYFTASPKLAGHYASEGAKRQGNEGANILPAHVAMKNPFVVDMKAYDSGAKTLDNALSRAGVPMHPRGWRKPSEQTAALVGMGHDGVIATREGKPEEYVAFHPTQIKSAISATTFDPNDPDITKADGGSVTDNENFRNWFGNSVTHTNGEPHVFYTGTSKDKDFTSHNAGRHGAWFTRDPAVASSYAEENDSQGYKRDGWNMVKTNTASRVIPAYVKAENPYTGELPEEYLRDNYKAAQSDWFDTLRAKGHDAWMPASQNGNLVVALKEPQQIKSIFNNGKFDPKQKHMNKAEGGRIAANKGGSMGALADFLAGNHPEVPNVVYHATTADFHDFRPLSHFGTMQAAHDRFKSSPKQQTNQNVIPAHISLKNPLDVGLEDDWQDNRDTIRQAADVMLNSKNPDRYYKMAAEKLQNLAYDPLWREHQLPLERQAAQILRDAGHDGIIYNNSVEDPGSRSFITLHPSQVKSAIGNQGTFDPNETDMTKAEGGEVEDDKPVDLGLARAMRRFNQIDNSPPPEVEGIFNRLAAAKDAAQEAHEAAHKAGAFDSAQIGDVFKYKPLDSYAPMKVVGHGMVHVSRWGGINPPKYVYKDHFPVAHVEYQDAAKERRSPAVELLEDRNLYNFISGKPRVVRKRGGAVNAALSATRRFTKDGKAATLALKPKGK